LSRYLFSLGLIFLSSGCADVEDHDHDHDHDHDNELITNVELTFTSATDSMTFAWADPDQTGAPTIDTISLTDGESYDLSVAFFNGLEDPPEDITLEIEDEGDQHQVFFTGTGVSSPAVGAVADAFIDQDYADTDVNGLPLGLENTLAVLSAGSGELVITLRHMPPENGEDVKVDGLAEMVATDGFAAIGGDNDTEVTFPFEAL
jgi:hypothetical protein